MGKIKNGVMKPVNWLKRIFKGPADFLRAGSPGGMIMNLLLGAQFFYAIVLSNYSVRFPAPLLFVGAVAAVAVISELSALILKLLFKGKHRSKSYFVMGFVMLCVGNMIGTQTGNMPQALLMDILMEISVDIIGRCIWGFIKTRRFKQVFAYVVFALSAVYFASFAYFLQNDNFGKSRVEFYLNGRSAGDAAVIQGFDEYLEQGEYEVKTLDYGSSDDYAVRTETVDISNFAECEGIYAFMKKMKAPFSLEEASVAGRIWYPSGLKERPVFFMVHGNHDDSTPSYLGYDYLGEYLASHGYVVVSVDENVVNGLSDENDARAVLLLENMKAILTEEARNGSPLYELIDEDRIVIGGHSRGGEMAATAYLFNDLTVYPDNGEIKFNYHFNISGIVAIAPCVDQYMPGDHAVQISDVNYLLIHGSNDQDVSTMMGNKQYNNITFTDKSEDDPEAEFLKASVYVMGANHGQFNTLWGRYDMMNGANEFLNTANFISKEDQETVAKAYIRVFLDKTINEDDTYASLLSNNSGYLDSLPKTVYVTNYMDSSYERMCSFDNAVDLTSGENNGVNVDCNSMKHWDATRTVYGYGTDKENYVLSCSWNEGTEPEICIGIPLTDMTSGGISFAIADMREDFSNNLPLEYEVELIDSNGESVTVRNPVYVYPSLGVQLFKQDVLFGTYEYKHQLQTVVVTPDMFSGNGRFNFASVSQVVIRLDGSSEGSVYIDDVCLFKK